MNVARSFCYALIGGILASGGITWREWQLYAVLLLVVAVALLSELITVVEGVERSEVTR
jgi:sulfite exporter TauE/SafE